MADRSSDKAHEQGGAAQRPDVGDKQQEQSDTTLSGREAFRVPPGEHDREHQSNYGGGGVNGGSGTDKK